MNKSAKKLRGDTPRGKGSRKIISQVRTGEVEKRSDGGTSSEESEGRFLLCPGLETLLDLLPTRKKIGQRTAGLNTARMAQMRKY